MSESLRAFIESASRGVERLFEANGRILPFYHFISERLGEVAMPPPPALNKDEAAAFMRQALAAAGATRVLFVDEAWTILRRGTRDALDRLQNEPPPREQPDRQEVVIFSAEDMDEGELLAHRDIIREPGKRPRLGPLVIHGRAVYSQGRMVGLLPRPANVRVN